MLPWVAIRVAQAAETASGFLCKALIDYFRGCQKRNPRWKLPPGLHGTILRQQAAHKDCVDFPFLLKELSATGGLSHVRLDAEKKADGGALTTSVMGVMEGASAGMMGLVGGAKSISGKAGRLKQKLMEAKEGDGGSDFDLYAQFS